MSLANVRDVEVGEGVFGVVTISEFAIKRYKGVSVPDHNIPRDAIRESSILHHLNDREVRCVPRLITMNSTENNTEAIIEAISGDTYLNIVSAGKTVEERCDIAELYLDNVLQAIDTIHKNRVIHNDMNLNNIMINGDNRVVIIDFGSSQFVNNHSTIAKITKDNEFLYLSRFSYQADYWLLSDAIIDACIGSTLSEWTAVQPYALDCTMYIKNGYSTIDNGGRILGEETLSLISGSLANRLRLLSYWNSVTNKLSPHPINRPAFKLDPSHNEYIGKILVELSSLLIEVSPAPTSIMHIIIDILRRIFSSIAYNYTPIDIALAITSVAWSYADITSTIDRVSNRNIIYKLRVKILDILQWRVSTLDNNQLINQGSTSTICRKIISDNNRHNLLSMSDEDLLRYYHNP